MNFNSHIPYNDLPTLPPKVDIETKAILKKTINGFDVEAGIIMQDGFQDYFCPAGNF